MINFKLPVTNIKIQNALVNKVVSGKARYWETIAYYRKFYVVTFQYNVYPVYKDKN